MFKPNNLLYKKQNTYKLNYSSFNSGMNSEIDENLLPHKQARLTYNYNAKDGLLRNGYGFKDVKLPKSQDNLNDLREIDRGDAGTILALWLFRWYDTQKQIKNYAYLYFDTTNNIRYSEIYSKWNDEICMQRPFTSRPCAFNFKIESENVMVFCSATDQMRVLNRNGVGDIQNAPRLIAACVHYDRVFAVLAGDLTRLVFSANLDVTNWNQSIDEAGYIEFADERGDLKKVLSFNDYVYIFRDYGVTRLSAYGEQTDFSVTHMFVSGVKIFSESVVACEDKVLYLASDGIHLFNGSSETRLELGIENLFYGCNNDQCAACFYKESYFLACRMNFDDGEKVGCENEEGYVNNVLLEIDLKTLKVNITRGVDITAALAIEDGILSKFVCGFRGKYGLKFGELTEDGLMFGEPMVKVWTSPLSNFGEPNKLKIVKEVILKTKSDLKIKIKTDKEVKTYDVIGKNTTQRIKTNVRGELIQISFITDTICETEVSCPQVVVSVV